MLAGHPASLRFPHVGDVANLFLVGAPRCGTTSLFAYLAGHPDVFAPAEKEPHFYDRDLLGAGGPSRDEYTELFASATTERWRLDASTLYLYSPGAPAAIAADVPDARIIVALRDPVELVASWHQLLVASGAETIIDLGSALDAEPRRQEGFEVPPGVAAPLLQYTSMGRFAPRVDRWRAMFGEEHVHVVLLEGLEAHPARTSASLLNALGLRPMPGHDFPHLNPARRTEGAAILAPLNRDSLVRSAVRTVVPQTVRRYVWHRLTRALTPYGERTPLDPVTRARLDALYADERALIARVRAAAESGHTI